MKLQKNVFVPPVLLLSLLSLLSCPYRESLRALLLHKANSGQHYCPKFMLPQYLEVSCYRKNIHARRWPLGVSTETEAGKTRTHLAKPGLILLCTRAWSAPGWSLLILHWLCLLSLGSGVFFCICPPFHESNHKCSEQFWPLLWNISLSKISTLFPLHDCFAEHKR